MSRLQTLISRLVDPETRRRLDAVDLSDAGHGYDRFGANLDWVAFGLRLTRPLHDHYFRVATEGARYIPKRGPCIVAANHGGTLPFDAAMLWANVLRNTDPPRIPRIVADYFVPRLPFAGQIFSRVGVVGGSRENARALLESGELLLIFPEGVGGISKPFSERYHLQRWHWGHAELAIRHRATIIPTAVIGPEEQMPQIAQLRVLRPFGIPYLPIPATPLPLPVHYYIYYGEPLELAGSYPPEAADDPKLLQAAADEVKKTVQGLIERGLSARHGVFR